MATIFVDESGYTGCDLINPPQPVFVLATHDLAESDAQELKGRHFGFVKADSLKFSELSRKLSDDPAALTRPQKAVVEFIADVFTSHSKRLLVHVIHKPFALVCKLVDCIVEPSMYASGVDLYDKGGNLALANALFWLTKLHTEDGYQANLLRAIQKFFYEPQLESKTRLMAILDHYTGVIVGPKRKGPIADFLSIPQLALLDFTDDSLRGLSKDDLRVTFPTTVLVMSKWGERHPNGFDVVHDQSSAMLKQFDLWARITSKDIPKTIVGMDRRTMQYPIGIDSTTFASDKDWAGLQLADIVAGAFARALKFRGGLTTDPAGQYELELMKVVDDCVLAENIWPQMAFTPKDLGTDGPKYADAFDFYHKHFD